MKKMTFTPPQLSDEERYAVYMPDQHKCDGCKVEEVFKYGTSSRKSYMA